LHLNWQDRAADLQVADSPNGPWRTLTPQALPPYPVLLDAQARFFRLKEN